MKKIVVLGVSSGIATYKTLELVKLLKKEAEVFVVMTKSATQMIDKKEFERASGNKVYSELFEKNFDYKHILKVRKVDHIDLADKADVIVVAPATANIIAKIAHGIADDFLTTTILAANSPVIICPSMNVHMWNNPITQENVLKLKTVGYIVIHPEKGMLACGYEGEGRLPQVEHILDEVDTQMRYSRSLKGKRIIITAGGTREKIDEVRFIANKSSGKMGVALAQECYLRGADVLLLRSKSSVTSRYVIPEKTFETVDELYTLLNQEVRKSDILFHAAAVSDFKVTKKVKGKISSTHSFDIHLVPQRKILHEIKKINPKIKLIAFKAEYGLSEERLLKVSLGALQKSHAEVVIANDISRSDRGFEADTNEVYIISKDKSIQKIPLAGKKEIASRIIDFLLVKI